MRAHINPKLGRLLLSELDTKRVRAWWRSFPPSKHTVRINAYRVLRSMMNAALEEELILANPVTIKGASKKPPVSEEKRALRERIASPSQLDQVAALLPPHLALAVYLAAWCGLRYGEVAGLQCGDIDTKRWCVQVRRAAKRAPDGSLVLGPPKSAKSRRDVPIPARIRPIIEKYLAARKGKTGDPLICNARGGMLSNRSLLRNYQAACEQVEGMEGFTFHQLRATCASQLMSTGASPVEIMAILGHSDWETSMLYQRAPQDRLVEAMDRMSQNAQ